MNAELLQQTVGVEVVALGGDLAVTQVHDVGTNTSRALDPVLRAADAIGVSCDVVADLQQIVMEEQVLRRRRHDLVVSPVLPRALNDSIGEATGRTLD